MKRPWRRLLPPVQATPSTAMRLRTRLDVTEEAREVLGHLGRLLGGHLSTDLAERCRRRHPGRTDRKRALTELTSSRWAGALTHEANRLYAAARQAQQLALRRTEAAIWTIQARLALPLRGEPHEDGHPPAPRRRQRWRAYASAAERATKQRRLQILTARAAQLRQDLAHGRVHICRGGKALARHRHYLLECGLTEEEWRQRWECARWFIHANGEAGKRYGNETIRVAPGEDGSLVVEIDLPPALAQRLWDTQASAGASGTIVRLIEGRRRCRGIPLWLHGSSDGPKFLFLLQVTTGLLCSTLGFTPPEEDIPDQQGGDSREEPSQSRAHGFSQTSSLVHGNMLPGQQSNEAPATSTHRLAAVFRECPILPFFHLVACNRQPICPPHWPLLLDCPGLRAQPA